MSSKIPLRLGPDQRVVELEESDSLIAVRRRPRAPAAPLAAATRGDQHLDLGEFEIHRIASRTATPTEVLTALRQSNTIEDGTPVFHTSNDGVPFIPTGSLYIEFREHATKEQIERVLREQKLAIVQARGGGRALVVATTSGVHSAVEIARTLQQLPYVSIAEPELATAVSRSQRPQRAPAELPVDEHIRDQWHLDNRGDHHGTTWGFVAGADARVIAAWNRHGLGHRDVVVAIIDDGFDLAHPDLGPDDKLVAPRDFTRRTSVPTPDWRSQDWHGTACAGVAVGAANGTLVVGAAPACRLMPVRWGRDLRDSEVEAWFDWVTEQGAWVVSCSWGAAAAVFQLSSRIHRAIQRCAERGRGGKGTVICFAAGNDGRDIDDLPRSLDGFATHPNVIAVSASNSCDQRSDYSNFGRNVWVCAPSSGAGGWGITTADVTGTFQVAGSVYEMGYAAGAVTSNFGGTSSACPLVAGVCALVLSANPDLTAVEVKDILRRSARKIGGGYDRDGHSPEFGYGCVNAGEAVRLALAGRSGASAAAFSQP